MHAHAFSLLNDHGEEVGRLGDNGDGEPMLKLTTRRSGATVMLGAIREDLAGFVMLGKDEHVVDPLTDRRGAPSLGLSTGDRHKLLLSVDDDHSPLLLLQNGKASLAATTESIHLKNAAGRISFSTRPDDHAGAERERR